MNNVGKPRARDLGLPLEGKPGEWNAITDVPGVEVGFSTLMKGDGELEVGVGPVYTGVTAILPRGHSAPPRPVWAGQFDLNLPVIERIVETVTVRAVRGIGVVYSV